MLAKSITERVFHSARFEKNRFDTLFAPTSVAVVGASCNPLKVGHAIVKNLIDDGFEGDIYPVNPNEEEILGLKAFKDVDTINARIDVAIIVLKAGLVPSILEDCGRNGVKSVVVISAGFRETDTDQGRKLESELAEIAARYEMLLVGPNCLGVIGTRAQMNATFSRGVPRTGNIAFVSQSGAIGIQALEFANHHDIGFSRFVTMGNKTAADENDFIEYLADDPDTKVIVVYLESFSDGERFARVAKKCVLEKNTPILVLKSGRSKIGQQAAMSHTGALASADGMVSYFLRDCGVLRLNNMQELFSAAMVISNQPLLASPRLVVLSNAGGPAIMAVDAAEQNGLEMVALERSISERLNTILPEAASVHNPIDLLGDADAKRYARSFEVLLESEAFDAVAIICTPQFMTDSAEIFTALAPLIAKARTLGLVVTTVFPSIQAPALIEQMNRLDVPNYEFPEIAIKALADASFFSGQKELVSVTSAGHNYAPNSKVRSLIGQYLDQGKTFLNEIESYHMLEQMELPIAPYALAHDVGEAMAKGLGIGYPVVAKIMAAGVVHKFDIGGVETKIRGSLEMEQAFKRLSDTVSLDRFQGVVIQKKVEEGTEVIIGVQYHEGFGHAIMFGLGGTYVEVLKDVQFAMIPLTEKRAEMMVTSIRSASILKKFRGRAEADIQALVKLILSISDLIIAAPEIQSLDLNPVFASHQGVTIADARIFLKSRKVR